MRTLTLLSLGLLAACDGGLGQYGLDTDLGPDDDTGVEDDSDAGSDIEDDTDDVDIDTDSGITGTAGDCHGFDPMDKSNWSRTYQTNYDGTVGTEVQTPGGLVTAPDGTQAYQINSTITPNDGTPPIQLVRYGNCSAGGAFWHGDDVQASTTIEFIPGFPLPTDVHNITYPLGPAQYLPASSSISSGLYTFEYTRLSKDATAQGGEPGLGSIMDIFGGGSMPNCKSDPTLVENDAICTDVSLEVLAVGPQNVTVGGTTFSAQVLVHTYEETPIAATGGGTGGIGDIGALLEALGFGGAFGGLLGFGGSEPSTMAHKYWYVEGIGVVKEEAYDISNNQTVSPDTLIVTRELTSYTGL